MPGDVNICIGTKQVFPDKSSVDKAINEIRRNKRNTKNNGFLKSYFCNVCDGWHITSKKKEQYENRLRHHKATEQLRK